MYFEKNAASGSQCGPSLSYERSIKRRIKKRCRIEESFLTSIFDRMRRDFIERLMLFESSSASYPSKRWNIGKLDVMAAYSDSTFSNITSSVKCPARICEISIHDDVEV